VRVLLEIPLMTLLDVVTVPLEWCAALGLVLRLPVVLWDDMGPKGSGGGSSSSAASMMLVGRRRSFMRKKGGHLPPPLVYDPPLQLDLSFQAYLERCVSGEEEEEEGVAIVVVMVVVVVVVIIVVEVMLLLSLVVVTLVVFRPYLTSPPPPILLLLQLPSRLANFHRLNPRKWCVLLQGFMDRKDSGILGKTIR